MHMTAVYRIHERWFWKVPISVYYNKRGIWGRHSNRYINKRIKALLVILMLAAAYYVCQLKNDTGKLTCRHRTIA